MKLFIVLSFLFFGIYSQAETSPSSTVPQDQSSNSKAESSKEALVSADSKIGKSATS